MIVALTIDLAEDWLTRLNQLLADRAMVVPAAAGAALRVAQRLPVSLVIMNAEPLTASKLLDYSRLCELVGKPVTICLGPPDVREQLRADKLFTPDYWVALETESAELQETLTQALAQVRLGARAAAVPSMAPSAPAPVAPPPPSPPHESILRNLLTALAGDSDTERLLAAYVEAAAQMAQCASYCLLWEEPGAGMLRVRASQGLPPELSEHGRLAPGDALVTWYRHNCRALTRTELSRWTDIERAATLGQELDIFRGQVVMPLLPGGLLQGLLILGEKVIGAPYTAPELETLFTLTGYIIVRLENLQLQEQVRHTQAYMERSLSGMRCGLITLGQDDRIVVCNPYAAHLLGRKARELVGADLRTLPSPLGDFLFGARQSPEAAVAGECVALPHRDQHLRITTSTLFDDHSQTIGAVLLLEDATGTVVEAAETARQETINALTRIIGRLAHEVRTPLTAIKTYAELMSRPDDLHELARFWRDTVNPELERLDRLITEQVRLVDQAEPNCRLVRLEQILEEVVARTAAEHPAAPPTLKVVAPLSEIVADPAPTRDALSYLLRYLYDHGTGGVGIVVDEHLTGTVPWVRVRMRVSPANESSDPAEVLDPLAVLQLDHGDLGPAIGRQLISRQGGAVEADQGADYLEFRVSFPVNVVDPSQVAKG